MPRTVEDKRRRESYWLEGIRRVTEFFKANRLEVPKFKNDYSVDCFGEYSVFERTISVAVSKTAVPTASARAWSYPGYSADRTAYGVTCHEAGHHYELLSIERDGNLRERWTNKFWRNRKPYGKEKPIGSYAETLPREDLAESFRLFLTNPSLLFALAPNRYGFFVFDEGLKLIETRGWKEILKDSPRHIRAVENKLPRRRKVV